MDQTREEELPTSAWQPLLDAMVDRLVADRLVTQPRIEAALRTIPRHVFAANTPLEQVYSGDVLQTLTDKAGRSLSTASHLAAVTSMLRQLDAQLGERILEIGSGTGYNAALIAALVGPGGFVAGIDIEPAVINLAVDNVLRIGLRNVELEAGDGWLGVDGHGMYDKIIVTIGVSDISPHWMGQLRDGGRLVVPLWIGMRLTLVTEFVKRGGSLIGGEYTPAWFLMLRGPNAGIGGYVRVGDYTVFMADRSRAAVSQLEELLASPPVETKLLGEPLTETFVTWLTLSESNAFVTDTNLVGVYDREPSGVAFVDRADMTVRSYGDLRTYQRLRGLIASAAPLPVRPYGKGQLADLQVDLVPHGTERAPDPGWLIARTHYDLRIAPRDAAGVHP